MALFLVGVAVVLLIAVMPIARWRSRPGALPTCGIWSRRNWRPPTLTSWQRPGCAASSTRPRRWRADLAMLETAAILGGRPPRGGAQRRFAGLVRSSVDPWRSIRARVLAAAREPYGRSQAARVRLRMRSRLPRAR